MAVHPGNLCLSKSEEAPYENTRQWTWLARGRSIEAYGTKEKRKMKGHARKKTENLYTHVQYTHVQCPVACAHMLPPIKVWLLLQPVLIESKENALFM